MKTNQALENELIKSIESADFEQLAQQPALDILNSIFDTIGEKVVSYDVAKTVYQVDTEQWNDEEIENAIGAMSEKELTELFEKLGLTKISNHAFLQQPEGRRILTVVCYKILLRITRQVRNKRAVNRYTFAMPSHPVMRMIISLFSGKSGNLPRRLLDRATEKEPSEEQAIQKFLQSIFVNEQFYKDNKLEKITYALICDTNKVEARAIVDQNLFQNDLDIQEEELAAYIKRTFGIEGLRHFYGFLIAMEENNRNGYFEWEVNEHLERLGYQRKQNGAFNAETKKFASKVLLLLTNLVLIAQTKTGKDKRQIEGVKLFHLEKFSMETFKNNIISERLGIRASELWYSPGFVANDGTRMFTRLLRKIAKENHQEHPLTIYLSPHLAIDWRMNREKKISVKNLMELCNLDMHSHHRLYYLRNLEAELAYMQKEGYIGDWENMTEPGKMPSECPEPFSCVLKIKSPEWLDEELKLIDEKKEQIRAYQPPQITKRSLSRADFIKVFESSRLSVKDFAEKLGISRRMFYFLKNGERELTPDLQDKILTLFSSTIPLL